MNVNEYGEYVDGECPVTFTSADLDSEELFSLVDMIDAGSSVLVDRLYDRLDLGIDLDNESLEDGIKRCKRIEETIGWYEEICTKAVGWIADLAGDRAEEEEENCEICKSIDAFMNFTVTE